MPVLNRLSWVASRDSAVPEGEVVRQRRRSDSGAAALKMVLDHYGAGAARKRSELKKDGPCRSGRCGAPTGAHQTSTSATHRAALSNAANGLMVRLPT